MLAPRPSLLQNKTYNLTRLQVQQGDMENLDKKESASFLVFLRNRKCFDVERGRYLTERRKERCFLEVFGGLQESADNYNHDKDSNGAFLASFALEWHPTLSPSRTWKNDATNKGIMNHGVLGLNI